MYNNTTTTALIVLGKCHTFNTGEFNRRIFVYAFSENATLIPIGFVGLKVGKNDTITNIVNNPQNNNEISKLILTFNLSNVRLIEKNVESNIDKIKEYYTKFIDENPKSQTQIPDAVQPVNDPDQSTNEYAGVAPVFLRKPNAEITFNTKASAILKGGKPVEQLQISDKPLDFYIDLTLSGPYYKFYM